MSKEQLTEKYVAFYCGHSNNFWPADVECDQTVQERRAFKSWSFSTDFLPLSLLAPSDVFIWQFVLQTCTFSFHFNARTKVIFPLQKTEHKTDNLKISELTVTTAALPSFLGPE